MCTSTSDVVKDKIARPRPRPRPSRPRPRPRPSRSRPRPRTRTLKAKTKATALDAKAEATAFEAEVWTFDVKDEPKFQSQILQFSIGALWYLNCISLGQ